MTEHSDQFLESGKAKGRPAQAVPPESLVSLQLPADLAILLQEHIRQSGQTQPEAIVSILHAALGHAAVTDQPNSAELASSERQELQQELQAVKTRLAQLEAWIPRLEALEGKPIAF